MTTYSYMAIDTEDTVPTIKFSKDINVANIGGAGTMEVIGVTDYSFKFDIAPTAVGTFSDTYKKKFMQSPDLAITGTLLMNVDQVFGNPTAPANTLANTGLLKQALSRQPLLMQFTWSGDGPNLQAVTAIVKLNNFNPTASDGSRFWQSTFTAEVDGDATIAARTV